MQAYSSSLAENRDACEIGHRTVRRNIGERRIVLERSRHFRNASIFCHFPVWAEQATFISQ
jgi:hypothetical protein